MFGGDAMFDWPWIEMQLATVLALAVLIVLFVVAMIRRRPK